MALNIKGKGIVSGDSSNQSKPKRAKTEDGKFAADDKSTPNYNEAWVGGESPKKNKKKKWKKSSSDKS